MDRKLATYIGCLLRVAYPGDEPYSMRFMPDEVAVAFYRHPDPQQADRVAHILHTEDPTLRERALEFLVGEDGDYVDFGLWFYSQAEAEAAAADIQRHIPEGLAVRVKAQFLWVYRHYEGKKNPWAVGAEYWDGDVSAAAVERVAVQAAREAGYKT